jgi:hypothetical protein
MRRAVGRFGYADHLSALHLVRAGRRFGSDSAIFASEVAAELMAES